MEFIRNKIGWEDEDGNQLAFDIEHSFFNTHRALAHKRPIWKDANVLEDEE